jgi:hypothetical protein
VGAGRDTRYRMATSVTGIPVRTSITRDTAARPHSAPPGIGLRPDVVNLDTPAVRVVRTVVEVSGNTSFKPYPKSMAGVRTVPLPSWVVSVLREHMQAFPASDSG